MRQFTLGDLIGAIEETRRGCVLRDDQRVHFDFVNLFPTSPLSYRGFYDHLALGYSTGGEAPFSWHLLAVLKECVGSAFDGYRGGSYVARLDTPLWVANWGECGSTAVVGLHGEPDDASLIIETARIIE